MVPATVLRDRGAEPGRLAEGSTLDRRSRRKANPISGCLGSHRPDEPGPGDDGPFSAANAGVAMGSLIKKRRKRMRKKKHKKMLKATRWQRRAGK